MIKVAIAASICQKENILQEYLRSLEELEKKNCDITYIFVDDQQTGNLLNNFAMRNPKTIIFDGLESEEYKCSEATHYWSNNLIWKVAALKNEIIDYVRQHNFDYIFFVDSDLVLHPKTLVHLINLNKDIISEIYWTKWLKEQPALPQVWLGGQYRLFTMEDGEVLSDNEIAQRQTSFLQMLKTPGVYRIGGLGACTLISRRAILAGVSFAKIENLDLIGEDRHFCVRAAVLGLELYVDTHYPAYHIYRESELDGLFTYRNSYQIMKTSLNKGKITLAMLVRNEAGRYLKLVLSNMAICVDEIVILDDASTDSTIEICKQAVGDKPITVVSNSMTTFNNEIKLRKQLWELAIKAGNEWILILDADEMLDGNANDVRQLINHDDCDVVCFRLYDMWSATDYRDDQWWCAHHSYRPFLVRYHPDFPYEWNEIPQHCGRFPCNLPAERAVCSEIRLQHFGWQRAVDRLKKYNRYCLLDPDARYGSREQYESILDPNPKLSKW